MNKDHVTAFANEIDSDRVMQRSVAQFKEFYAKELRNLQAAEKAFRNLVVLLLRNRPGLEEPKISSRIKERDECIKKFSDKYQKKAEIVDGVYDIKSHISDLIGIRVVCLYETDISTVQEILEEHFDRIDITNKTEEVEKSENQFGYKGLHLDLILEKQRKVLPEYRPFDGIKFEIQVRTIVQDGWSEVDHKLKYKRHIPIKLQRRINRLAALFELADQEFEAIRDLTTKLEAEANENAESGATAGPVTSIDLSNLMKVLFPDFSPNYTTIESFVEEILDLKSDIGAIELNRAVKDHIVDAKNFADYLYDLNERGMAPYTQIRLCLYAARPQNFADLLTPGQIKNFDNWKRYGTVLPDEIRERKLDRTEHFPTDDPNTPPPENTVQ